MAKTTRRNNPSVYIVKCGNFVVRQRVDKKRIRIHEIQYKDTSRKHPLNTSLELEPRFSAGDHLRAVKYLLRYLASMHTLGEPFSALLQYIAKSDPDYWTRLTAVKTHRIYDKLGFNNSYDIDNIRRVQITSLVGSYTGMYEENDPYKSLTRKPRELVPFICSMNRTGLLPNHLAVFICQFL